MSTQFSMRRIATMVFAISTVSLAVYLVAGPVVESQAERLGTLADWVSGLGTWVVGYAALRISRADGMQIKEDRLNARLRAKQEESAQLFATQSLARNALYFTDSAIEYFEGEPPLPERTTRWVLSRLIGQIDDLRISTVPLAALKDAEKDLVHEIEADSNWLKAIARDLLDEIASEPDMVVAEHFAVEHLVSTMRAIQGEAQKLSNLIVQKRTLVNEDIARLMRGS